MRDDLYVKVRRRVVRRLSGSPRAATLNALAFTLFALIVGPIGTFMTYRFDVAHGPVYALILIWSFLLFLHVGYVYLHSGARRAGRDRVIREEVADTGEMLGLTGDELAQLHVQLDAESRAQAQLYNQLMLNAFVNLLLWLGMPLALPSVMSGYVGILDPFTRAMMGFSLIGTFLMAFALPVGLLLPNREAKREQAIRSLYSDKRKRTQRRHDETAERLSVGDDGELIAEPMDESQEYDFRQAE